LALLFPVSEGVLTRKPSDAIKLHKVDDTFTEFILSKEFKPMVYKWEKWCPVRHGCEQSAKVMAKIARTVEDIEAKRDPKEKMLAAGALQRMTVTAQDAFNDFAEQRKTFDDMWESMPGTEVPNPNFAKGLGSEKIRVVSVKELAKFSSMPEVAEQALTFGDLNGDGVLVKAEFSAYMHACTELVIAFIPADERRRGYEKLYRDMLCWLGDAGHCSQDDIKEGVANKEELDQEKAELKEEALEKNGLKAKKEYTHDDEPYWLRHEQQD